MKDLFLQHCFKTVTQIQTHLVEVTMTFDLESGNPVKVELTCGRIGSTLDGLCSTIGEILSMALQRGASWSEIRPFLLYHRFEPMDESAPSIPHLVAEIGDAMIVAFRDLREQILNRPDETTPPQSDPEPSPGSVSRPHVVGE